MFNLYILGYVDKKTSYALHVLLFTLCKFKENRLYLTVRIVFQVFTSTQQPSSLEAFNP